MEILQEPNEVLQKYMSQFKFVREKGKSYRPSFYTTIINVEDDIMLFYNFLNRACVEITPEDNLLDDYFFDNLFMVEEDFDEGVWAYHLFLTMEDYKSQHKLDYDKIQGYLIYPTMDCNARCFYCYESKGNKFPMKEETALALINFIVKHNKEKKEISLTWFGGEPLYNTPIINLICNKLKENGISFNSSIITNAFLFNKKLIVHSISKWKLNKAQITIDGTEKVYNKIKNYKGYKGNAFKKLMKNIHNLIDMGIAVSIRLNVDYYNAEDMLNLIDYLYEEFKGKVFSVYAHRLFSNYPTTTDTKEKEQILIKYLEKIDDKLEKFGLAVEKQENNTYKETHCVADNLAGLSVLPNGDFTLCEHCYDSHIIGNIFTEEKNQEAIDSLTKLKEPSDKCLNCPLFLFDCAGRGMICDNSEYCTEEYKNYLLSQKKKQVKRLFIYDK